MLRLGDVLVRRGVITDAQRNAALRQQRATGRPFGEIVEELFGVEQAAIEAAWAEQYATITRTVDPRREKAEPDALRLIERRQAWQFRVLPLRMDGDELVVCTTADNLVRALKFTGWRLGLPCYFVLSDAMALGEALMKHYPLPGMTAEMALARGLAVA